MAAPNKKQKAKGILPAIGGFIGKEILDPAKNQQRRVNDVWNTFMGQLYTPPPKNNAGGGDFGAPAAPVPAASATPGAPGAVATTGSPVDYMAAYNQYLDMATGPAPTFGFDNSPYLMAIQQAQQQAQLGQGVINKGGQDLMARLAQLRAQTETRGREDAAAIQAMQQKALGAAQGSVSPVLADLQAQGVNVAPVQQAANQRIGVMQDQAGLQNILSQRMQQNTGQVMDATQRSAATQGAGALNTLSTNLSNVVGGIAQKQAAAAAQASGDYMQSLAAYNKSRMGAGQDFLKMLTDRASDGTTGVDAPDAQIAAGRTQLRNTLAGRQDPTAQTALGTLGMLDAGELTAEDFNAKLDAPAIDPTTKKPLKVEGKDNPTFSDYYKSIGVDVGTLKQWVKDYAYPTVKEPSAAEKKKQSTSSIVSQLFGVR